MSGQPSVSGGQDFFQLLLDVADRVVAEVTGQAAAKTRQPRPQRHLEALLVGGDEVQWIAARAFDHRGVLHHFGQCVRPEAAGAQQRARRQADEAVAAEAFAADHRLQQEAVLACVPGVGQLEVQGQRCFEVGERFHHQWNAVEALQRKALEFEFGDHGLSLHKLRGRRCRGSFTQGALQRGKARGTGCPCRYERTNRDGRQGQAPRSLKPVMWVR